MTLVVLRPDPGAGRTAERAGRLGLAVCCIPLFTATQIAWQPPDAHDFDALLLTSAQAARLAGPALARYRALPAYAVGSATADALREQGFETVFAGTGDGSAIAARIAQDGHRAVLHLAGETVAPLEPGPLTMVRVPVYEMAELPEAPTRLNAVGPGAVLLVHSPRAGQRLAALLPLARREMLHIVAISPQACVAAGVGWASTQAAPRPHDDDMLALAADLCK